MPAFPFRRILRIVTAWAARSRTGHPEIFHYRADRKMAGSLQPILEMVAEKKSGTRALEALLTKGKIPQDLIAVTDNRRNSKIAKPVFQAKFAWSVIEKIWEEFDTPFEGLKPRPVSVYDNHDLDTLLADRVITRNRAYIRRTIENTAFLVPFANKHGSAATVFVEWPDNDWISLLTMMKKRRNQLGGNTMQYLLPFLGKPAFIPCKQPVTGVIRECVLDKVPSGERKVDRIQFPSIGWRSETRRGFSLLSRILPATA